MYRVASIRSGIGESVEECEELKPCPFCGGEAEMLNYSENEWLVHCRMCDGMAERWRKTEKEAIEQWNRRANDEAD